VHSGLHCIRCGVFSSDDSFFTALTSVHIPVSRSNTRIQVRVQVGTRADHLAIPYCLLTGYLDTYVGIIWALACVYADMHQVSPKVTIEASVETKWPDPQVFK